jgi:hypothetical protein
MNAGALPFTLSEGFRLGLWREGCLVQNLAPGRRISNKLAFQADRRKLSVFLQRHCTGLVLDVIGAKDEDRSRSFNESEDAWDDLVQQ